MLQGTYFLLVIVAILVVKRITSSLLLMSSLLTSCRAVARMDGYQELTNRLQLHLNRQFQLQLQVCCWGSLFGMFFGLLVGLWLD